MAMRDAFYVQDRTITMTRKSGGKIDWVGIFLGKIDWMRSVTTQE